MQGQVEAIIRIAENERMIVLGYQKFCLSGQRIGFMMGQMYLWGTIRNGEKKDH